MNEDLEPGRAAANADPPLLAPQEVVLVTGISGSGKSVALHALEDAGFFCVDNLPPELLRAFLLLEHRRSDRRVAIAVDVRSAGSLPHLLPALTQLRGAQLAGVDHRRHLAQLGEQLALELDRIDQRAPPVTGDLHRAVA